MNWPWKLTNHACPVVIRDDAQGRLWAQAEETPPLRARHWFWQDCQQPLPQDLRHTDMRTVAYILPCGAVRWYVVTLPPVSADETERMLAWEVADLIGAEDCPRQIWQSLPRADEGVGMTEILVGIVARDVLAGVRSVCPQGMKIRKIVPEEVAIGAALPVPDARVLYVRGDECIALSYRDRLPVEVSVRQDASLAEYGYEDERPWYVVADDEGTRETWQARLHAQSWPRLPHHEYLTAGGTRDEVYPQIVLGASSAARGRLCWTQDTTDSPPLLGKWRERVPWSRLAMAVGVVGTVAAAVGGVAYKSATDTLAQASAAYSAQAPERQELAALTSAQDALVQRQQQRNVWSKILLIVADSRPEGVYLTAISEEDERIVLTGVCLQPQALQEWKTYLQLRLQRHAVVKYTHAQAQGEREFRLVLHGSEDE